MKIEIQTIQLGHKLYHTFEVSDDFFKDNQHKVSDQTKQFYGALIKLYGPLEENIEDGM